MPVINIHNAGTVSRAKKTTTTPKTKNDTPRTDRRRPASPTKSASATSKKPVVEGSSSEIEILSGPPTPTKKTGVAREFPSAGSAAFSKLSNFVSATLHASRTGAMDSSSTGHDSKVHTNETKHALEAPTTPVKQVAKKKITEHATLLKRARSTSGSPPALGPALEITARPQRDKKKTERAMYSERLLAAKPPTKKQRRPRVVSSSTEGDDLPATSDIMVGVDVSLGGTPPALDSVANTAPVDEDSMKNAEPSIKPELRTPEKLFLDEEADEGVDGEADEIDEEADEAEEDADKEDEEIMSQSADGEAGSVAADHESTASVDNVETVLDAVLDRSLQDPVLYPIYDGLPILDRACEVHPFGTNTDSTLQIAFKDLKKALRPSDLEQVIKALIFTATSDHKFVNTARADPSILYADSPLESQNKGIRIKSTGRIAQLVMPGLITNSNIISAAQGGLGNQFEVHGVTLAPFFQEWVRDTAAWGIILDMDRVAGTVSVDGIQFTTKRPPRDNYSHSQSSSLRKKSVSTLASSVQISASSGHTNQWQYSRDFDNPVPIYDGRPDYGRTFDFTDAHFQDLPSWPLWRDGAHDIPTDSVAAVGYTVNTYVGGSGKTCLSTNIQFVILLGLPKSYKESTLKMASSIRRK